MTTADWWPDQEDFRPPPGGTRKQAIEQSTGHDLGIVLALIYLGDSVQLAGANIARALRGDGQ